MNIKTKIFLLISTIYCVAHQAHALPIMGSQFTGQISAPSDAGVRIIALPQGGWKVFFSNQGTKVAYPDSPAMTISNTSNNIDTAYLIQVTPSPFVLGIQYNTTSSFKKYPDVLCKSDASYYTDSYDTLNWNQRCLTVGFVPSTSVFDGWSEANKAKSALIKGGTTMPQGFIEMNYTQYNTKGNWIQVRLLVNPEDYGLKGGNASQWDRDMIADDYKKFINEYVIFAKIYADSLSESFKGQYSGMRNNFSPSSSYVGGATSNTNANAKPSSASGNLNTSKEEGVCRDIGFKPKTESFANCVLQLLQKKVN